MDKFKILFLMQLREKIDLSFLKDKKQTLFKIVFSILGFVAVTAIAYGILFVCQFLNLFSALNHIPVSVMTVVLTVIFFFNLFGCTNGLTKTLYMAKDNQVLVTFPVNANLLFLSKMLVYGINEIKKAFSFIIPIFVGYGLLSGMPILYYPWIIIMLSILALFIVALSGLLSIPCSYVMNFLNRYKIIKISLGVIVLLVVVFAVILLINLIPADINLIKSWTTVSIWLRNFLSGFTNIFAPFYAFTIFLCGKYENLKVILFTEYSYIVLLVLLGSIALLVLLNYVLSRPMYIKQISKQFEFEKNITKTQPNKTVNGKYSTLVYETKKILRNGSIFATTIAVIVIAPIAVLLLNKIYAAISTRLMGDYLTQAFNVLIISLFVLAHNISVSNIYSRDGDSMMYTKTLPQKSFNLLVSRLFYNSVSSLLIILATVPIFVVFSGLSFFEGLLIFVMIYAMSLTHIVWSADIDFLNPKTSLYKTEGSVSTNPNEVKSSILAFAICLIVFGIIFFFMLKDANLVWLKLAVVCSLVFVLRFFLFKYKVKVMYREVL